MGEMFHTMLGQCLACLHPVLHSLSSTPGSGSDSSFLLMYTERHQVIGQVTGSPPPDVTGLH